MKKILLLPILGTAMSAWLPLSIAREVVVLPGVVGPVGIVSGVDTRGPGLLTVGNQNINTANDAGGAITTSAANSASILFTGTSTVTGAVGATGSTFLNIAAGANANAVIFNGPVYSTTFSVSGSGSVSFNKGFTSNTGSTMDFAGDGAISVGAGQTVKAAITNSAGAHTGTLILHGNSIVDGAVGAASGLKQITLDNGNALITGQANAASFTLGTNTLNVAGALAIPVAGTINTTIFSSSLYGKIVPVGASTIGNALQVYVTVTGPIASGSSFNIVDATSGTNGSTVTATSNTTRYLFSAAPTVAGTVKITTTQIPLVDVVAPVGGPTTAPVILAPVVDALPLTPATTPLLTAITLLPNAPAVADALAQLQPGVANLSGPQVGYRVTQQFQELWTAHLEKAQAACGMNDRTEDRTQPQRNGVACPSKERSGHWWMAAFGYDASQRTAKGFEGYDADSHGGMLAYDAPLSDSTTAGAGLRYAQSALDGNASRAHGDIESFQVTAYLGYAPGPWFANGSVSYGLDHYSGSRRVAFQGFDQSASANYSGHEYTAFGTTGYHFYVGDGRTVITPLATLQYTRLHTNQYTEAGGDAINLRVNQQSYNFLQSGLGVKIAREISLAGGQSLRPELHANWLHAYRDETMRNTAAFASGGATFTAVGLTPERNTYDVGAGVVFAHSARWSIEGAYDYQWNDTYKAYQAMVKFVMAL